MENTDLLFMNKVNEILERISQRRNIGLINFVLI